MAKKLPPREALGKCRSGKDFVNFGSRMGADVLPGAKHFKVRTPRGTAIVPVHGNKDLGEGLRKALIRTFIAIGLAALILAYLALPI